MTSSEHTPASGPLPKIWYTRILTDVEVMHEADCIMFQNDVHDRLRFQGHYELWEDDPGGNVPIRIKFMYERKQIKKSTPDAFCIFGGYLIISRKLRDVLTEFDLGASEFIELPIYEEDGTTPTRYPPHYLLHVKSTKPTLVPEESKNIKKPIPPGATEPLPEARWGRTYVPDELAVKASSASGTDLWGDVILHGRLFLSDRLKRAIESAGVKSKGLKFSRRRWCPKACRSSGARPPNLIAHVSEIGSVPHLMRDADALFRSVPHSMRDLGELFHGVADRCPGPSRRRSNPSGMPA